MRRRAKKQSRKPIIPLVIAIALILFGGIGAFAVTSSGMLESQDYRAHFYLNHLQVHLLENGRDVCDGQNQMGSTDKATGELVQYLGYSREGTTETLGIVEPGKLYEEVIEAQNGQKVPIYVRMTIKKYWVDTADQESEDSGSKTKTAGDKNPVLSPDKIHLMYDGREYNDEAWFINESESTAEQTTYYYKSQLGDDDVTEPLFDSLVIDSDIVDKEEVSRTEKDGVTTVKYKYKYDGYAFMIKADVQAIQTHNANDAIRSQWGVYDVVENDGTLSPGH